MSGLVEVVLNPLLGRFSDRVGRLLPIRVAPGASVVVAVALAVHLERRSSLCSWRCRRQLRQPLHAGLSLTSHRAEAAGLAQGLAFGVMNTAWAFGEVVGPSAGGALADSYRDAAPYLVGAGLCAITLAATQHAAGRIRPRAA